MKEKVKNLNRAELEELLIKQNAKIKPNNPVSIEMLDAGLRVKNIQLGKEIIKEVINTYKLIEQKGDEVSLMDLLKK